MSPFTQARGASCETCRHFDNAPDRMERALPGLAILSSGTASARDADGICTLYERYLSARSSCARYAPR
jgi:hypothetical protein